jgi:hypothetical protein
LSRITLWLTCKVLDDHVYTMKTWADLCGISQVEIRLQEVEFAKNIGYSLLPTTEQWLDWRIKMASFHQYLEKAARLQPLISDISTMGHLDPELPPKHSSVVFKDPAPSIANKDVTFLPWQPERRPREQPRSLASISEITHRLAYVSAGSPIIHYVQDFGSSPFERCSPRYHLSTSPDYYRRDITSTNPLSFLSPFPIRSSNAKPKLILISPSDTTAAPLKTPRDALRKY